MPGFEEIELRIVPQRLDRELRRPTEGANWEQIVECIIHSPSIRSPQRYESRVK
jgi:hypothetical protein